MDRLLIDTSVLVAAERGQLSLESVAASFPGARLAISVITVSELLHGYHRAKPRARRLARQKFITALLARWEILPFDLAVAREHARLWADLAQQGEGIGPHDLIIAATAVGYDAPLATLNAREFQKVKGLKLHALQPSHS